MTPDNFDDRIMQARREQIVDAATTPTVRVTRNNQIFHVKGSGTINVAAPDIAGIRAVFVAATSGVAANIVFPASIENVVPATTVVMNSQLDICEVVSYRQLSNNTMRWCLVSQYNCTLS